MKLKIAIAIIISTLAFSCNVSQNKAKKRKAKFVTHKLNEKWFDNTVCPLNK